MVQIQMFILHKNFTKWAAGCTKTFGEGVKGGGKLRLKKATWTVVSHWAGAKLRDGGAPTWPHAHCMHSHAHSLPVNEEEGHVSNLRIPEMVGGGGPPPWLAAEYCIQDT